MLLKTTENWNGVQDGSVRLTEGRPRNASGDAWGTDPEVRGYWPRSSSERSTDGTSKHREGMRSRWDRNVTSHDVTFKLPGWGVGYRTGGSGSCPLLRCITQRSFGMLCHVIYTEVLRITPSFFAVHVPDRGMRRDILHADRLGFGNGFQTRDRAMQQPDGGENNYVRTEI